MNSINNTPNNVNFTAKMDIKGVKNGAKRLQNIAEMFEAKTQKYPNDTFEIKDFGEEGVRLYQYDKGCEHEHCADISVSQWDKFMTNNNETIAKKLIKLFNIFKKEDKEVDKAGKYIVSVIKKDKNNDPTNFEGKFWDIVIDKTKKDTEIAIAKDSTLKNLARYY